MPESGPYGSVRGALSNERPYRDRKEMHSALFVALEPTNPTQQWLDFVEDTSRNEEIARHASRLSNNVWLVNFQKSPAALGFFDFLR